MLIFLSMLETDAERQVFLGLRLANVIFPTTHLLQRTPCKTHG